MLLLDYTLFFQTISPLCSAHLVASPFFQHACSLSHVVDTFTFTLSIMQVICESADQCQAKADPSVCFICRNLSLIFREEVEGLLNSIALNDHRDILKEMQKV